MNGRKIFRDNENFIDNIFIDLCDIVCVKLRRLPNITPNMITTVGVLTTILTIYLFYKKMFLLASIAYIFTYFTDCLDGHYARKYNMSSRFGDYYDHIRDILLHSSIIYLIFINLKDEKILFILSVIIFFPLTLIHLGCQERNSCSLNHNETMNNFTSLCLNKNNIKFTKYFGCGTFILIIVLWILYLEYKKIV